MLDPYKVVEELSALEKKILEKYTPEDVEKLYEVLKDIGCSRSDFALRVFSSGSYPDFSLKKVLSRKGFSNDQDRNVLFFQRIVLSLVLEVFRAAESFYPGISEYEMLHLAGMRLSNLVWEDFWPFSEMKEDPRKVRKNRQVPSVSRQSRESTPE